MCPQRANAEGADQRAGKRFIKIEATCSSLRNFAATL